MRPHTSFGQSLPGGLRLATALIVGALLVLVPFAARANAAAADFPYSLYLSGSASSVVTGSRTLTGSAGIGGGLAAPTALAVAGTGMGAFAGWTYVYTLVDAGGAETAPSAISNSVTTTAANAQVQLTLPAGLPAGVTVRIYRKRTQHFLFVADVPSSTATYTDAASDPSSSTILPQAQNRVGFVSGGCVATNCGYAEFLPGTNVVNFPTAPPSAQTAPNALTATASTTPNNRGWLVETAGPVKFAAGTWTFRAQYKSGVHTSGVAHLVVGLWKVTVSGGAIVSWTLLVDPNGAGEQTTTNLINNTNAVQTASHSVTLPVVSLAAGEHLYVQFWRRQMTPYSVPMSADARTITLYANDGYTRIDHPAADDAAPGAFGITAPASGGFVKNGFVLQSSPSDPTPGSGLASVDYLYCLPLVDCSFAPNRTSIGSSAASPYSFTWSGQPADGAYQLVTRATDNVGNATETAAVPITVDNTAPDTSLTLTPSNPSNGNPSFGFSSGEPGTFECSLDAAPFAACASPDALGGLATGSHTFQVRAIDRAGNVDGTPASLAWSVDATAPTASFTSTPANPTASAAAGFSFTASEPATFDCRLDGAPYASCTSPRSLSGLADGSHTFEVRATDTVGNTGSTSYTWTIDTTTPVVTLGSTPAKLTNSNTATFSFTENEPATFECRLDGAAYAPCSSPHSVTPLADGSHTFDVEATDAVGHVGSASFNWTVDTFAPTPPALDQPAAAAPTRSLRLTAVYTGPEAGGNGFVEFRVCADESCATVVATGPSAHVTKGDTASWSIDVALPDGKYYWQARSVDSAGNVSGWSRMWSFTRDTVGPVAPEGFIGVVAGDGLTLRWTAPPGGDQIGNYVVYVDGKQWRVLGEVTYEVKAGAFDAGDTRSFTVSAIDTAGNEGPQSTALVSVPDVVGLSLPAAKDAIQARGLVLDDLRTVPAEGTPSLVVAQTPSAPGLAPKGSIVEVVVGTAPTTTPQPLVEINKGAVCGTRGDLTLQVRLRERAVVTLNVFNARDKRLVTKRLGVRPPGLTNHRLKLKTLTRPGRYSLVVTAKGLAGTGRDSMTLTVSRAKARAARTGC